MRKFAGRQVQSNDMQSNLAPDANPARNTGSGHWPASRNLHIHHFPDGPESSTTRDESWELSKCQFARHYGGCESLKGEGVFFFFLGRKVRHLGERYIIKGCLYHKQNWNNLCFSLFLLKVTGTFFIGLFYKQSITFHSYAFALMP